MDLNPEQVEALARIGYEATLRPYAKSGWEHAWLSLPDRVRTDWRTAASAILLKAESFRSISETNGVQEPAEAGG